MGERGDSPFSCGSTTTGVTFGVILLDTNDWMVVKFRQGKLDVSLEVHWKDREAGRKDFPGQQRNQVTSLEDTSIRSQKGQYRGPLNVFLITTQNHHHHQQKENYEVGGMGHLWGSVN